MPPTISVSRASSVQSFHSSFLSTSLSHTAAGQCNSSSSSSTSVFSSSLSTSASSSSTTPSTVSGNCKDECQQPPQQGSSSTSPERTMGLMSAILMIIGTLIGTGIFASPGPLFDSVRSTQTSFMIWGFAGIICTIGAFAYAELGTMFPESGGDFQYLSRAYGKKVALVFGWSFITILNPIGTAGIAGVLGRYSVDVIIYFRTGTSAGIGGASPAGYEQQAFNATGFPSVLNGTGYNVPRVHSLYAPGTPGYDSIPKVPLPQEYTGAVLPSAAHTDEMPWVVRSFSIGAIILMGLINIFFKEGGKYASNVLAIFKIAGMCMLIVIGSVQAVKNHAQSEALSIPIENSSQNILDYVSALCFAFFAYNGFNNINLGLGELRDPERNLKKAVWIAMPFVTILFLLANFAFFSILSSYDLRHVHSLSLHAGHTVLGQPGGLLMAGTVIASALGSINANIWAGSRLLVIMAKDNAIIPSTVSKVWKRAGTQAFAIIILIMQASIHALINLDFKTFSKIYSAVGWSWYGLSIAGLLYLRRTKPSYPRPVKVFWPLALGFVLVAFFLVFGSLTLAFMSSSKKASSDSEEEKIGADKYMSVVMFGMAILFMLGVIPAFYLTRWYNRRRNVKHGSATGVSSTGGQNNNNNDKNDNDSDNDSNDRDEATSNQEELVPRATTRQQPTIEVDGSDDEKPLRRHSGASSITLVGESKRKRRQQRRHLDNGDGLGISRSGSLQINGDDDEGDDDDDDDDEEGTTRAQALNAARLGRHDGLGIAEAGGSCSSEYGNRINNKSGYFSPTSPSPLCMSPVFTIPSGSFSSSPCGSSSHSPISRYLDLPRIEKFGSRSSETTLGLEAYMCSKEGKEEEEEGQDTTKDQYLDSEQNDRIEELDIDESRSGSYFLDIPLFTNNSPLSPPPRPRVLERQNTDITFTDERVHPFDMPSLTENPFC
ncbi:hypothetical protein BGX27_000410 [Mortierella sp. AM989]|nr:hypothetical protein BGX27_000410 [Mortierella sp. AM989]